MNEEIMNEIQPVRPKDQFTFSCRQCGACCRNIEGCVMVESLDAYRLARYLRAKGEPIEGIEDFLFRYCEPEPLTEEGFPIYMLKTKAPNSSCIFLTDGRCSVYPARTRTCRIYPLTVGPGERGRDFEYCLCLDRHQSHFTGSRVSVKDWLYQNFKREDKEYVKREYEIATELGKLMRAIDAAFQRQDIDEIESLALALRKEIDAALQPFYMGHMCLYVTPECFDDPPKTPEVYNDATACVWRDGTWQLLEDTSKGFLLFVQSKSKEEAAA